MSFNPKQLVMRALEDGGFSVFPNGDVPSKGYAVAIDKQHEMAVSTGLDLAKAIDIYCDLFKDDLRQPGRMLGGWICRGQLYLDISEVIEDRDVALALGRERDQEAIYRLDDSTEIPCNVED